MPHPTDLSLAVQSLYQTFACYPLRFDALSNELGLLCLPYLEDMPDELDVRWDDD